MSAVPIPGHRGPSERKIRAQTTMHVIHTSLHLNMCDTRVLSKDDFAKFLSCSRTVINKGKHAVYVYHRFDSHLVSLYDGDIMVKLPIDDENEDDDQERIVDRDWIIHCSVENTSCWDLFNAEAAAERLEGPPSQRVEHVISLTPESVILKVLVRVPGGDRVTGSDKVWLYIVDFEDPGHENPYCKEYGNPRFSVDLILERLEPVDGLCAIMSKMCGDVIDDA
jgi:hypothetical protein